jgi:hypothetical protein
MEIPEYNFDNVEEKSPMKKDEPGDYFFEVVDAKNKTAQSSGNVYTSLVMMVDTGEREAKVFTSMFYSEKSLFRLKQFIDATGVTPPKEPEDYIGASGKAHFVLNDKGYLEPKWYISKAEAGESPVAKVKETFKADDQNIPF